MYNIAVTFKWLAKIIPTFKREIYKFNRKQNFISFNVEPELLQKVECKSTFGSLRGIYNRSIRSKASLVILHTFFDSIREE